jgi:16S rRNA (cytosine1402-N4)-methyltransferase
MTHLPVLYQEIIHALQPEQSADGGLFVDGTLGAGGHAAGILEASAPAGQLVGFEVDPQALRLAQERLRPYGGRALILHTSYIHLEAELAARSLGPVAGIVLDLGASSMQFDTPDRGFSFQQDAPLDMRFDPANPVQAADLVNHLAEGELADLIFRYGEEPRSRQIARAIVQARPLHTTLELAAVVQRAVGRGRAGARSIHPATLTFQALRIAVNRELDAVEAVLPQAVRVLAPGGRLAVIAFHSLEDRLVKQFLRQEGRDCVCPPRQPVCTCGHRATLREVTRRPLRPQPGEIAANPRARSARLRVAEKLALT